MGRTKRRKYRNRIGIFSISFVVICLFAVITVKGQALRAKNELYIQKEAELDKKIAQEEKRSEELKEYSKYVKTKKYIEEVAREKLGLIYEDEMIFKAK